MREATVNRTTKETEVKITLNLDGSGKCEVNTGIAFFDHMLELLGKHGGFDLYVQCTGDVEVDFHHTVEDVGIVFGSTVSKALGRREKIKRFGWAAVPMDEAFALVSVDISGRGYLVFDVDSLKNLYAGDFPLILLESFFTAFARSAEVTLHIYPKNGRDPHHISESIFKSFARALREAVSEDTKISDIPSTKGRLKEDE